MEKTWSCGWPHPRNVGLPSGAGLLERSGMCWKDSWRYKSLLTLSCFCLTRSLIIPRSKLSDTSSPHKKNDPVNWMNLDPPTTDQWSPKTRRVYIMGQLTAQLQFKTHKPCTMTNIVFLFLLLRDGPVSRLFCVTCLVLVWQLKSIK